MLKAAFRSGRPHNQTTDVDAWFCSRLGVVIPCISLVTVRTGRIELRRDSSLAVGGEGRGHGMAESAERVPKERQLVSGTVRH